MSHVFDIISYSQVQTRLEFGLKKTADICPSRLKEFFGYFPKMRIFLFQRTGQMAQQGFFLNSAAACFEPTSAELHQTGTSEALLTQLPRRGDSKKIILTLIFPS